MATQTVVLIRVSLESGEVVVELDYDDAGLTTDGEGVELIDLQDIIGARVINTTANAAEFLIRRNKGPNKDEIIQVAAPPGTNEVPRGQARKVEDVTYVGLATTR